MLTENKFLDSVEGKCIWFNLDATVLHDLIIRQRINLSEMLVKVCWNADPTSLSLPLSLSLANGYWWSEIYERDIPADRFGVEMWQIMSVSHILYKTAAQFVIS